MPVLPTFTTPAKPPRNRRRLDWPAHLTSLAMLLLVYLAGYSAGRDTSLSHVAHHPACHPNLRP